MPKIFIVFGLGFGDEGKGTTVDFLARNYDAGLAARYNGGAQAGHNVVSPAGDRHCFAQFGSGTLIPGVETLLPREMLIEPQNMINENNGLRKIGVFDAFDRLTVDPNAAIITPYHKMIGQMKEIARGKNRFGSCGMGVGETIRDRRNNIEISLRDFFNENGLRGKLDILRDAKTAQAESLARVFPSSEMLETYEYFSESYGVESLAEFYLDFAANTKIKIDIDWKFLKNKIRKGKSIIFEGAQGALLDETNGFAPYITKGRATYHNAAGLLAKTEIVSQKYKIEKVGVLRAYGHRHGAGPFVTEDEKLGDVFFEPYNKQNRWQGKFRLGWLDLLAIRYGILINDGVDYLALTNLDQLSALQTIKACSSYLYEGELKALDPFFVYEKIGGKKAKITAFQNPAFADANREDLAKILFKCVPLDFLEFKGWQRDISQAKNFSDLPIEAREYIDFLESPQGLNAPIKIISVSPRADGKIIKN